MTEINYLQADNMKFERSDGGLLTVTTDGQFYEDVVLQRAFPLSKPWEFISVKTSAEHRDMSREIGMIRDIRTLPEESRRLVEEELSWRYFVPVVRKITSFKDEYGQIHIDIQTDAGDKKIVVTNTASSFVRPDGDRLILIDADGNRYDIPSLSAMDKKTKRFLEAVL